jgi:hypothetical protein
MSFQLKMKAVGSCRILVALEDVDELDEDM